MSLNNNTSLIASGAFNNELITIRKLILHLKEELEIEKASNVISLLKNITKGMAGELKKTSSLSGGNSIKINSIIKQINSSLVKNDDERLNNARTPTSHNHDISQITGIELYSKSEINSIVAKINLLIQEECANDVSKGDLDDLLIDVKKRFSNINNDIKSSNKTIAVINNKIPLLDGAAKKIPTIEKKIISLDGNTAKNTKSIENVLSDIKKINSKSIEIPNIKDLDGVKIKDPKDGQTLIFEDGVLKNKGRKSSIYDQTLSGSTLFSGLRDTPDFYAGFSDKIVIVNAGETGVEFSTITATDISGHISDTSNPHSVTKAQVGLGNVEDIALSTWAGSTSLTTLGTITTGTWNADIIDIAYGGTGQSTAQGAINALTQVAAATAEFVLTKDTATGDAIYKAIPDLAIGDPITSATEGSVLFAGVGGILQQDNANFFWDDTNNYLGIGTATPNSKVHIKGSTDMTQFKIQAAPGQTMMTNPLFVMEDSAGSPILEITTNALGSVYIGRTNSVNATTAATGNIAIGFSAGTFITTGQDNLFMSTEAGDLVTSGSRNIGFGNLSLASATTQNDLIAIGTKALQNSTGTSNLAIGSSAMNSLTTGSDNISLGLNSMKTVTTGTANVVIGNSAMSAAGTAVTNCVAIGSNALLNNTTDGNLAIGRRAMESNTTGTTNMGIGWLSLFSNTVGNNNTAIGSFSLYYNTTGVLNTAVGSNAFFNNTTASNGVAIGPQAAFNNTTGDFNTAIGGTALFTNTTGSLNTAIGTQALYSNTTGVGNMAVGTYSLFRNITGIYNVGVGYRTLFNNTSGVHNLAIGSQSLEANTVGNYNSAVGYRTLWKNTSGLYNVATGYKALQFNTTGDFNVASGYAAMINNISGQRNTASGYASLNNNSTGSYNSAFGVTALFSNTTGGFNVALGYAAGYLNTGSNNVFIGREAGYNETGSDKLYISNSNTATPLIRGEFDNGWAGVNGAVREKVVTVTADYTVTISDNIILVDASAGNVIITLLTSASSYTSVGGLGQAIGITKIDSSAFTVTIVVTGGGNVGGDTSQILSLEQENLSFIADGTDWHSGG